MGNTGKVCNKCNLLQLVTNFKKDKRRVSGYTGICNECTNKKNKEYQTKNIEKYKERWKKRYYEIDKPKGRSLKYYYSHKKERLQYHKLRYIRLHKLKINHNGRPLSKPSSIPCKHCKSINTFAYGKSWYNGAKQYRCRDCKRVFQNEYIYENQKIECPNCKSHETKRESIMHSSYAFKCKDCNKYFNIAYVIGKCTRYGFYKEVIYKIIEMLIKGIGIRQIARILNISGATVVKYNKILKSGVFLNKN